MTSRPSGPHRGQLPSPDSRGADPSLDRGDPPGLHSSRPDKGDVVPLLRVVRGEPSGEELAALTVVVAALSQRRPERRLTSVRGWAAHGDTHRRPLRPGPGGWRAAGRNS